MGFNTAVIILNDHLHEIEKDPEFGQKLAHAIRVAGREGQYNSGFDVLPTQHADTMQVCIVGGNSIQRLGFSHWSDDKEGVLRTIARDMGFDLRKRTK